MKKRFEFNDGGRSNYFKTEAGDCVARSIAIASGMDYKKVYDALAAGNASQRTSKREKITKARHKVKTASNGIYTKRKWFKDLMREWGFEWTPTMKIGSGCKVHLRREELPSGRLVVAVSKHYTAVVNGVIHDTYDPSREGTRCVYGYWKLNKQS